MKELRRLAIHAVLLLAAAGFAYQQSLPDDPSKVPPQPGEVELWAHAPDAVTRVELVDERQKVVLERKSDDRGAYYHGQVEPVAGAPAPETPDAGPHSPPPPRPVEAATFVSVEKGDEIAKKLAPLRAKRLVGEVAADREAAFGLDKTEGTLIIDVGGSRHELVIGGPTPGAADRYVRYKKDNLVYVIDATPVRNMQGGAALLAERQQHSFKMTDVESAVVQGGEISRSLVRGGSAGRRFWAAADSPEVNDETAGNWLGKLDNLRPLPNGFVDKLPDGAQRVVRVEYKRGSEALGFTELYLSRAGDDTYYLVTETLRMPAAVSKAVAAQVRDDLAVMLGTAPPEPAPEEPDGAPGDAPLEGPGEALPEGHPPVPGGPPDAPKAPGEPKAPPGAPKAPPEAGAKGAPPAPPKGPPPKGP